MAGTGWRTDRSLIRQMLSDPAWFDAFQAIRLIEADAARAAAAGGPGFLPVGQGSDSGAEVLRFHGSLSAVHTGNPVQEVRRRETPSGRLRYAVRVNFMGLGGSFGPLPQPISDLLVDRVRAGDTAMRDFLDLFNHRLVSLMVRARRAHRPELTGRAPWDSNVAGYVAALSGLGTRHLQGRMAVPDRALNRVAGLLNRTTASQHGLERILSTHFGVEARIEPLDGAWLALEPEDRTILGRRAEATRLGRGAVLGTRVWDQTAGIAVVLDGLDMARFVTFLPGHGGARALQDLVRFHAGPDLRIRLVLRLRPDAVPPLTLHRGAGEDRALGRTAFLGRPRSGPAQAVIRLDER
ncbi:MAG: hypothetical protein RLY86_983 [Pseudomonadota bacterium]